MPTVLRFAPYRFHFYSSDAEEPRVSWVNPPQPRECAPEREEAARDD